MANGGADDQPELRYREKQVEFSKRWYQAHVRRAEADADYELSERRRGSRDGDPGRSASKFLEFVTGHRLTGSPAERDARYAELVADLDNDAGRFESVASWWDEKKPTFLDPVLVDRCDYGRHPEAVPSELLRSNAAALVGIARHLRDILAKGRVRRGRAPCQAGGPAPRMEEGASEIGSLG